MTTQEPASDLARLLADLPAKLVGAAATPQLLTPDEAAAYSGVSRSALYRLVSEGKLRQVAVPGARPKFRKADLDRWIAALKPAR